MTTTTFRKEINGVDVTITSVSWSPEDALFLITLLSKGYSEHDISKKMQRTGFSIRKFTARLRQQYSAQNNTHLVAIAIREGII